MRLDKLSYSTYDCISMLEEICIELDLDVQIEEKPNHFVLRIVHTQQSDGIVRIYSSRSNGRTLDGSGGNKDLNVLVLTIFLDRHCQAETAKIKSKTSIYNLKGNQIDQLYEIIQRTASKNEFEIIERDTPTHASYMLEIKNTKNKDKVIATQFNSGKLLVQGRSWDVWYEICNAIDEVLNVPIEDIIIRLMSKEGELITDIVNSNLKSNGQEAIKIRLGKAYDFLYDHDKKLIISSQCMFIAGVDFGDYYCYVAPCLRVLEGYLKKVMVALELFTETEIEELNDNGKRTFHFGKVFNGLHGVLPSIKTKLSTEPDIADKKEQELLLIYERYQKTRNPLQHDGPPVQLTVDSYDEAQSYFDEIVGVIHTTYQKLFYSK